MKIRNGYVSNSSTSSFIVIGYLINDTDSSKFTNIAKIINNGNIDSYFIFNKNKLCCIQGNNDDGFKRGTTFVGKYINKINNEQEYNIEENLENIQEQLKEFEPFLNDKEKEIKIFVKTQYI